MASKTNNKGRSAHNAGSIRQKPNGSWEARVTVKRDINGKQVQKSHSEPTQELAQKWLNETLAEISKGEYTAPDKTTIGKWLDEWLELYNKKIKDSTLHEYKRICELYLKPAIGGANIQKIKAEDITRFYNSLQDEKGLSPKTIKNIHGVLSKALNKAVVIGKIRFNPAHYCAEDLPKVVKTEIKPMDAETVKRFLNAIQCNPYETMYQIALYTGLRRGELCGLSWTDISFKQGTITIRNQWQRNRDTGVYTLNPTKNSKVRTIVPPSSAMALLKYHKTIQDGKKRAAGKAWKDFEACFTNNIGERVSPQTIYCDYKKIVVGLGCPELRLHDLRHTFATMSIKAGVDLKTLQSNMGHYSSAFTLDTYGFALDEMKRDGAQKLEEQFAQIKEA